MSTATPEAPKKNRTVLDQHGQSYELTGRIGEGGQGIVCTTNYPNVLVKVARATTEEKRVSWTSKIRALMRQPLEGLPIAHPQALITQPQPGYVMELMDGLAPMTELMALSLLAEIVIALRNDRWDRFPDSGCTGATSSTPTRVKTARSD